MLKGSYSTYLTFIYSRLLDTAGAVDLRECFLSFTVTSTLFGGNLGLVAMVSAAAVMGMLVAMGRTPWQLANLFSECSVFLFYLSNPQLQGQCGGLMLRWGQGWLH